MRGSFSPACWAPLASSTRYSRGVMPEPDPLEALAAKGRESQAREQDEQSRKHKARRARARRKHSDVLRLSLESQSGGVIAFTMLTASGIAALLGFGAWLLTDNDVMFGVVAAVGFVPGFLLVNRLVSNFEGDRELRWLDQVPFPLDREHYLARLSTLYSSDVRVNVKVQFIAPVPESARALIVEAMSEAVFIKVDEGPAAKKRRSKIAFRSDSLHIDSPAITTQFTHRSTNGGSSKTVHHNRYVHRWFRRCLDRGLGAVRARYLIEAVEFTIE